MYGDRDSDSNKRQKKEKNGEKDEERKKERERKKESVPRLFSYSLRISLRATSTHADTSRLSVKGWNHQCGTHTRHALTILLHGSHGTMCSFVVVIDIRVRKKFSFLWFL